MESSSKGGRQRKAGAGAGAGRPVKKKKSGSYLEWAGERLEAVSGLDLLARAEDINVIQVKVLAALADEVRGCRAVLALIEADLESGCDTLARGLMKIKRAPEPAGKRCGV